VKPDRAALADQERYYLASQRQLMWLKFRKHKLALAGGGVLLLMYVLAVFCEFFAPQDPYRRYTEYIYCPPQRVRFFEIDGRFRLRPFVYGLRREVDPNTLLRLYREDPSRRYPLSLLVRGDRYRLWGLVESDLHLFGVEGGVLFAFGTDKLGRDLLSRTLYAIRISLSIGLIGVAVSFVLGCAIGGISGFYGGTTDLLIQRVIEFLISIPIIPFWMGLAAALPSNWPTLRIYFAITVILGIISWPRLARVVRGKLISVREEDFVMAARVAGAPEATIIVRHMLPSFMSYLIVSLTLSIPQMVLGETALSFLGLGLQPPVVSWGVLLQDAQNLRTVSQSPWLLIPGLFVMLTVLSFNFVGDGLRDAADPYK
jgi:peptide/nickel transport system permease protein